MNWINILPRERVCCTLDLRGVSVKTDNDLATDAVASTPLDVAGQPCELSIPHDAIPLQLKNEHAWGAVHKSRVRD
jgi:hypothetical protein